MCPGRALKRCKNCKTVAYCSVGCQRAHWRIHRYHCNELKGLLKSLDTIRDRVCMFPHCHQNRFNNEIYCSQECEEADDPDNHISMPVASTEATKEGMGKIDTEALVAAMSVLSEPALFVCLVRPTEDIMKLINGTVKPKVRMDDVDIIVIADVYGSNVNKLQEAINPNSHIQTHKPDKTNDPGNVV